MRAGDLHNFKLKQFLGSFYVGKQWCKKNDLKRLSVSKMHWICKQTNYNVLDLIAINGWVGFGHAETGYYEGKILLLVYNRLLFSQTV